MELGNAPRSIALHPGLEFIGVGGLEIRFISDADEWVRRR